jgi:4-aminobutyrate aminotransferase-like enzyme
MPKSINTAAIELLAAIDAAPDSSPPSVLRAADRLRKALSRVRKAQQRSGRKATGRKPSVDREAVLKALERHGGRVAAVVAEGIASEGTVRAIRRAISPSG